MLILGIETSCDESALAVLKLEQGVPQILAEDISSQVKLHAAYGGVVPELAAREHLSNLPLLLDSVIKKSSIELKDLDLIAVTQGPGLKGCLLMGLGFAKGLALAANTKLCGINHIEGHILSAALSNPTLDYPFLALVVSGGHSEIVAVRSLANYEILARTNDDAAGEAFDKAANLLGFDYPGGAKLAACADSFGTASGNFVLPKVMREAQGFSFSGLKTAISQCVARAKLNAQEEEQKAKLIGDLSSTIQESIVDALVYKLEKAVLQSGISKVAIVGGVSANKRLRKRVAEISYHGKLIQLFLPSAQHCMDNAAMIAYVAGLRYNAGLVNTQDVWYTDVRSRWGVEELIR